ncbi:MAG: YkgJ family cysteine cluster protein [Desulfobacterales bacterium]
MENDLVPLDIDDRFRFACTPRVPCFNACCRDLHQYLTPYDILRLKNRLGLRSGVFLKRYTEAGIGPQTGLPVIRLRMNSGRGFACPFVTDDGCSVYEDRPASCRIYPVARAIRRCRRTGAVTEHFALLREPHCRGFEQEKTQSVREWIQRQDMEVYNRFNDLLLDIIQLKNQRLPGPLDLRFRSAFHLGLYDPDAFRDHLDRNGFPESLNTSPSDSEAILSDELERLRFGHRWVRWSLFEARSRSADEPLSKP